MKKILKFIFIVIGTLGIGSLPALLVGDSITKYQDLVKPPFSPPGYLFPIVWTILFILMGIAAFIVSESKLQLKHRALKVYVRQLLVNSLWTVIFFYYNAYLFAFIWLLILLYMVILMLKWFYDVNKVTLYLILPYVIWLLYAGYLNFGIYLLNR